MKTPELKLLSPEMLEKIKARQERADRAGIHIDYAESLRDVKRLLGHIAAREAQMNLFD